MINYLRNIYYSLFPFCTIVYRYFCKRKINAQYQKLLDIINLHDEAFLPLNKLGFQHDDKHHDLRALVPRGKLCPDAIDAATVEIDAQIWLGDQFQELYRILSLYNLVNDYVVDVTYLSEQDVVACFLIPDSIEDYNNAKPFVPINIVCTCMIMLISLLTCIILL